MAEEQLNSAGFSFTRKRKRSMLKNVFIAEIQIVCEAKAANSERLKI